MANGTSTFILCPRASGFRSPGLVYGDVEDPGALANPDEHIPCIAPYGIRRNPIWNTVITRWDGYPCDFEADAASEEPPDDIAVSNLTDEEEESGAFVAPEEGRPRRPQIPLRELNLVLVDDETREDIESIKGQWDRYYKQVRIVTDLLRSKS
jgi:hypothetical protein